MPVSIKHIKIVWYEYFSDYIKKIPFELRTTEHTDMARKYANRKIKELYR